MNRKYVRVFAGTVTCGLLALALTGTAAAKEWDLRRGDIIITEKEGQLQTVTQGENSEQDSAPVITSQNAETEYSVKIETDETSEVRFTVKELKQKAGSGAAFEIGSSNAWIRMEDNNQVEASGEAAAFQVDQGNLILIMKKGSQLTVKSEAGAGLGSGASTAFEGAVDIGGNGQLNINSGSGACIGAGAGGAMNGEVSVGIKTGMTLMSKGGSKIGSGENGEGTGTVRIEKEVTISGRTADDQVLKDNVEKNLTVSLEEPGDVMKAAYAKPGRREPCPVHRSIQKLYWINVGTRRIQGDGFVQDGVLTVSTDAENAELDSSAYGLLRLQKHGIHTLVFRTAQKESSIDVDKTAEGRNKNEFMKLEHKGKEAAFTVNGKDLTSQLK